MHSRTSATRPPRSSKKAVPSTSSSGIRRKK
jgi:hypothetical protein